MFSVASAALSAYVSLAGRIGERLNSARARKRVGQAGGGQMIGSGVCMALR